MPPWEVDDSTAQTVSKLNSVFGFRPSTGNSRTAMIPPDEAAGYSPDFGSDRTPELRHDTPSDTRTRTSSFGPETPPTKFDQSFPPEPHVQPLTPSRQGHSHLRSYSDSCSFQSFHSDHRAISEAASSVDYDYKPHSHTALMPQPAETHATRAPPPDATSHHVYAVNLTRDNRSVILCLTSGGPTNPAQPAITCYRQTYMSIDGQFSEFFKASEALSLLQHMVNAPSQPYVPLSSRERAELMHRMRTSSESMVLGEPCPNARAWTSFFSTELAAGRNWEPGTVIFPWSMLQKLMNSLNAECGRKRRLQGRAGGSMLRREVDDHAGSRPSSHRSRLSESRNVSLHLASDSDMAVDASADHISTSSASPPPFTPTDPSQPPRLQLMRDRVRSPPSSSSIIRRRRQNSEPVRRVGFSPPRIALLKSNPSKQNLRRLHAAFIPSRLEFYDSIRLWPASSHRSRVRLPPCSRFLELTAEHGNPGPPIAL
ncbi:hypothetical protein CTRI78_v008880 [Colletotrichum trifolii]|uniref:Uncharacterized protein n=1 Tax=Colletotrichum trifolii TaxID=5466 RepID=A0A4V6QEP3_COLTR|nr:hypothetical protein CTRI78_v008880 [Colletotrichum trifolii]